MKYRLISIFTFLLVCVSAAWLLWPRPTPNSVMNDFLYGDGNRAEDMIMDPLILHADLVKHRVIEEVKNPTMPKRRYAIGFLGVARIQESLPVLQVILQNENEKDYFRGDALASIYQISKEKGLFRANEYSSREDFLGYVAKGLLDGTFRPFERSYVQARSGYHQ